MKFFSKYKKLQLWLQPAKYAYSANGERFYDPGKMIQFDQGAADVYDPEDIRRLRESPLFASGEITTLDPIPEVAQVTEEKPNFYPELKADPTNELACQYCHKVCLSKLGRMSHERNCKAKKL